MSGLHISGGDYLVSAISIETGWTPAPSGTIVILLLQQIV